MPADPNPTPAEILSAERVAEMQADVETRAHIMRLDLAGACSSSDEEMRDRIESDFRDNFPALLASHAALAARCAELEKARDGAEDRVYAELADGPMEGIDDPNVTHRQCVAGVIGFFQGFHMGRLGDTFMKEAVIANREPEFAHSNSMWLLGYESGERMARVTPLEVKLAAARARIAALEDAETRLVPRSVLLMRVAEATRALLKELDEWDTAMETILGPRAHKWGAKEMAREMVGHYDELKGAAIDAARKEATS